MKLVTFVQPQGHARAGMLLGKRVVDLHQASEGSMPSNLLSLIESHEEWMPKLCEWAKGEWQPPEDAVYELNKVKLLAPLPKPPSVRDFYAFEQHVKAARSRRGLEVIPEWYEIPVFYFSNHHAIIGPDEPIQRPAQCKWLDYELEIACIIGKEGRNIPAAQAEEYIFGYCILNDWSARDLQIKEMKVGLGPAKGKDFATSLGPFLVTKDELEIYRVHDRYDLEMTASVNGRLLSSGNFKDIYYTFAQMIERASQDATLYPGDVIGSGTVGTGCILELGIETHRWLEPGDIVELSVTGLGVLRNSIK